MAEHAINPWSRDMTPPFLSFGHAVSPWARKPARAKDYASQRVFFQADWAEVERGKQTIRAIGDLPENWDGYGAARVDQDIVAHGVAFLSSLPASPTVIEPHPAGTLVFEWHATGGRAYLEIGRTRYTFYAKSTTGEPSVFGGLFTELDSAKTSQISLAINMLVKGVDITPVSTSHIQFLPPNGAEQHSF